MTATTKTAPTGPLREPLPAIYPVTIIEAACRALETISEATRGGMLPDQLALAKTTAEISLRIIHDGLLSHERQVLEGRSRG